MGDYTFIGGRVPQDGFGEYEVWPTRAAYERATSGMAARSRPMPWTGHPIAGLGDVAAVKVPYSYSTSGGVVGAYAAVDPWQPECGSVFGTQQMLIDLGYGKTAIGTLVVDGQRGPVTNAALAKFAVDHSAPYMPGTDPKGALCAILINKWLSTQQQPPGECPAGQTKVFGFCMPSGQVPPPAPSGGCPQGWVGSPPYCMPTALPPGWEQPTPPPATPPSTSTCPPGTIGWPPACLPFKWPPGEPVPTMCPPGTTGSPPNCAPAPCPSGMVGTPGNCQPAPEPKKAGLSTGAIIGIVAGGVGLVALVAALAAGKKKSAPSSYRPNPRKAKMANVPHRKTAPKRYRKTGATKRSDYAWPKGFAYPIHKAKYVRAALGRFGKYKSRYPSAVRRTIAKRLNMAKKRFSIGGKPVKS